MTGAAAYGPEDKRRRSGEPEREDRPAFKLDYDRLVHKPIFRALQGKTQVVTPGQADFFRTRLTHTIEVAQLARRMGERLNSDPDVIEAAAILHDLGHPPFGHVGEDEFRERIDATAEELGLRGESHDLVGGFEGNAQSLRIAMRASIWRHSGRRDGLDLTRAVLDGATKYPWVYGEDRVDKYCFYPNRHGREAYAWVREGVPAERDGTLSFEAQVMDWADEVAYAIHDLEDWYRAGFIPLALLVNSAPERERCINQILELWRLANVDPATDPNAPLDKTIRGRTLKAKDVRAGFDGLFGSESGAGLIDLVLTEYDGSRAANDQIHSMRSGLFGIFVIPITDWVADPGAPRARHANDLTIPFECALQNELLRAMLRIYVTGSPRLVTQQRGQRRVVGELWKEHVGELQAWLDTGNEAKLTLFPAYVVDFIRDTHGDAELDKQERHAELIRIVADYLTGLSDVAAARLHARLRGHDQGSVNAFLT